MFKILYAVMTEQMPEGFEDNLVFAEALILLLCALHSACAKSFHMLPFPNISENSRNFHSK